MWRTYWLDRRWGDEPWNEEWEKPASIRLFHLHINFTNSFIQSVISFAPSFHSNLLHSFEIATTKRVPPLLHSHSIQSIIITIILVVSSCVNIINTRLHKYFIAWSRNVRFYKRSRCTRVCVCLYSYAFCRKMIKKTSFIRHKWWRINS